MISYESDTHTMLKLNDNATSSAIMQVYLLPLSYQSSYDNNNTFETNDNHNEISFTIAKPTTVMMMTYDTITSVATTTTTSLYKSNTDEMTIAVTMITPLYESNNNPPLFNTNNNNGDSYVVPLIRR